MISFFKPENGTSHLITLSDDTWKDLELGLLAGEFRRLPLPAGKIKSYLEQIETEPEAIKWRQESLKFLMKSPQITKTLNALINDWIYLKESASSRSLPPLERLIRRLGELDTWIRIVEGIQLCFDEIDGPVHGTWAILKKMAQETSAQENYKSLKTELPKIREGIQGIRAVSIGINLNHALEPIGAVLLTVEQEKYTGKRAGIMGKLFQSSEGPLSQLYHPPYKTLQLANQTMIQDPEEHGWGVNPKSIPLFRDLEEILKKTAQDMEKKLVQYTSLNLEPWRQMADDIIFLTFSSGILTSWIEKGISLTFPSILDPSNPETRIKGMMHPPLILKGISDFKPIPNDINWSDEGRVHIITGPNSGGKTVYLQSLGWAQILFQLGWPIPAEEASISPARSFGTHFQKEEETGRGAGKFGDEIIRLKTLFTELEDGGVLLLNESLSGTNAMESYAIAWDLMKVLRVRSARAGFTTHMHDLARDVEEINKEVQGRSKVVSVVAEPGTFKVSFGIPSGRSLAREVARKHGVSFEDLVGLPENV